MVLDIRRALGSIIPIQRFRDPPPLVAVVRLSGVIGQVGPFRSGLTLEALREPIERAFRVKRLAAVALAVNSPGGSPVQSAMIARHIRELADEKQVRVLAFVEDVAASGGYWLATAGDEIWVDPSSIVGSIGVVSAGFGFPELIKRLGVERRLETAGERKALLDPFQPRNEEEVQHLRGLLSELHEVFKQQVRTRRGDRLKAPEDLLFSGEFWSGQKAVELGLADGIGHMHQELRRRYGRRVVIQPVQRPRRWLFWRPAQVAAPKEWADSAIAALEERASWSRYGL